MARVVINLPNMVGSAMKLTVKSGFCFKSQDRFNFNSKFQVFSMIQTFNQAKSMFFSVNQTIFFTNLLR